MALSREWSLAGAAARGGDGGGGHMWAMLSALAMVRRTHKVDLLASLTAGLHHPGTREVLGCERV